MAESTNFYFALWQLVARTTYIMGRARQRELNQFGMTSRNSAVLCTIMRLGNNATLSNIAQQLVLEVHSMSAQLKRMEKDGLIERISDHRKRNRMRIVVTDKGYELFIKGMERRTINSMMSVLTEEEQRNLWVIMAKLREQSMLELGKANQSLYPPSDPAELPPPSQQEGTKENLLLNKSTLFL